MIRARRYCSSLRTINDIRPDIDNRPCRASLTLRSRGSPPGCIFLLRFFFLFFLFFPAARGRGNIFLRQRFRARYARYANRGAEGRPARKSCMLHLRVTCARCYNEVIRLLSVVLRSRIPRTCGEFGVRGVKRSRIDLTEITGDFNFRLAGSELPLAFASRAR